MTIHPVEEKMEVEDIQGNDVTVSGIAEYFIARKPGGVRQRTFFYVADDMEGDDLLIGITTMKKWGILQEDFPKEDPEKFEKSSELAKSLDFHMNRIAKAAEKKPAEEAHSTEVLELEKGEVTVNLTKTSSQQRRKEDRKDKKTQFKRQKYILKEMERDKELEAMKNDLVKQYEKVFSVKLGKQNRIKCKPVHIEMVDNYAEMEKKNYSTPRPVFPHLKASANEQIRELLQAGLIEECTKATTHCSIGKFIPKKKHPVKRDS